MATPPKTPTGPTPPRRKAAARKPTPTAAKPPKDEPPAEGADASAAAPKKPAAPKRSTRSSSTPKKAPAKPRAAARPAPSRTAAARKAVTDSAPAKYVADTREKMGDRNFFAAVIGATAALGAAITGIVLAVRNGRPADPDAALAPDASAHQPDGTDSSAQFQAGIADENTIPNA